MRKFLKIRLIDVKFSVCKLESQTGIGLVVKDTKPTTGERRRISNETVNKTGGHRSFVKDKRKEWYNFRTIGNVLPKIFQCKQGDR